ncbi:MAG: TonB-dependent receptor domain-containing protein [Gammaproteobacteria bacterium]
MPGAYAAEAEAADDDLEEVVVTGSRIVRRDLETNSPLLTIDIQQFEDNTFISVEEALNDLPQFMAGGVGMSAAAVTSMQAANGLEGGLGSGDAMNSTLLPNNAQALGVVVPGAANVNLRGLGANRSLTLIDGHRAMPLNASMIVDLNTIPSIAIGGMEVITGGASAVYGADALAGVTNIKFRDNYEGMQVRVRGGTNEVGDGDEYQLGALLGARFADNRGSVMIGIEYSKREETLWAERDHFREVMESQYSNSGDYLFAWDPYYSSGAATGTYNTFQGAWNGGAPSQAAIAAVFPNNTCPGGTTACIANTTTGVPHAGNGWAFNPDGTIYTRSSQIVRGSGPSAVTTYYGPQGYNQSAVSTPANPMEVTCSFTANGTSASAEFPGEPCNPQVNRVDWNKWVSSPRDSYNMFARATFDVTDTVEAYTNFHVASSSTFTRREPAPLLGGFGVIIPFDSTADGNQIYLPSVNLNTGATRPEYRTGGTKGTVCGPTGGCTMAQAFPVPAELRTLLESRSTPANIGTTGQNANNPFRGLPECNEYALATTSGPGVLTNPVSGATYTVQMDPNTGLPVNSCGPNAGWQLNQQPAWLPPRGTENTANLFQIALGIRGELGISDWTWDLYTSHGTSETQTNYVGFQSIRNYQKLLSAPNYGKGYSETGPASKYITCQSGLNPFDPNLKVTQDCIDAIIINPVDRNTMQQRIWELTSQGHVMNLPAGEMRGALGATYRWNAFVFQPDVVVDRNYIGDYSAGAFGSGRLDEEVSVKEVYGELLIPLLTDLPLIQSLEMELGARYSEYSTGQEVKTYKILGSWAPVDSLRIRGGYNRAERAPNMSELYATPNGSAQFGSFPNDPCRNNTQGATTNFPGPTTGSTLNNTDTTDPAFRAKLQALCSAHINAWGGNNQSEFHADPNGWNVSGGGSLVVGNPELRNEQGDTWTLGAAFTSPWDHPLLERVTGTVDWYRARVTDPVELLQIGTIVNSCFNINGLNPNFELDDPLGFCSLIERDPGTGGIQRAYIEYANQGRLQIEGVDVSLRWSAAMADLGIESLPGTLSLNTNMNFLLEQTQRYGVTGLGDYAGFGGASKFRASSGLTYSWDRHRVTLQYNYREGTDSNTQFATVANAEGTNSPTLQRNPIFTGYKDTHLFNLTASTMIYDTNVSFSISNLFDKKPRPGGYDIRDPRSGFGTFSPFDDLNGRRYSFNVTREF